MPKPPARPPTAVITTLLLSAVMLVVPTAARAQEKKIAATVAFVNSFSSGEIDSHHYWGLTGALAGSLAPGVGLMVEASAEQRSATFNSSYAFLTIAGGPRFGPMTGQVRPFVQLPIGLANMRMEYQDGPVRFSGDGHKSFIFRPGAGLDVVLSKEFTIRVGVDYVVISQGSSRSFVRLVTGMTVKV